MFPSLPKDVGGILVKRMGGGFQVNLRHNFIKKIPRKRELKTAGPMSTLDPVLVVTSFVLLLNDTNIIGHHRNPVVTKGVVRVVKSNIV